MIFVLVVASLAVFQEHISTKLFFEFSKIQDPCVQIILSFQKISVSFF